MRNRILERCPDVCRTFSGGPARSGRNLDRSAGANRRHRCGVTTSAEFATAVLALGDSTNEIFPSGATGKKNSLTRAENWRSRRTVAIRSRSFDRQHTGRGRSAGAQRAANGAFESLSRGRRWRLTRHCGFFQIVNCAPGSGSGERCGFFPRAGARSIICLFFAAPKNVTRVKGASEVAPIRGALHQFCEEVVRFAVMIESLRPKVARITHHDFSTLEQQGMVVSRPRRKTFFQRHLADSEPNRIQFAAIGETETAFSRGQPTK